MEEVSLPILQKIRNDSSSNDEKDSLFLETINDDPIMMSALRQNKEQHDKGNICDYCDSQYNYFMNMYNCTSVYSTYMYM